MSEQPNPTESAEKTPATEEKPETEEKPASEAKPEQEKGNGKQPIAAGGDPEPEPEEKPTWPDDWRKRFAAQVTEDEKEQSRILKQLARYVDPAAIYSKTRELEAKFSGGGLTKLPGKNASEEEIAEFHKALGVPEKADGYFEHVKLENGMELGDEDKEVAASFMADLHAAGAPPAVVNAAVNWYFNNQEQQAAALDEHDTDFRLQSERELKEEYGSAYNRYVNNIQSLYPLVPGGAETIDAWLGGRTSGGTLLGNDPSFVRFLVTLAHEINPAAAVVEDGDMSGKGIDTELAEIRKTMRSDRRAYDRDPAMQKRYLELVEAKQKFDARKT